MNRNAACSGGCDYIPTTCEGSSMGEKHAPGLQVDLILLLAPGMPTLLILKNPFER